MPKSVEQRLLAALEKCERQRGTIRKLRRKHRAAVKRADGAVAVREQADRLVSSLEEQLYHALNKAEVDIDGLVELYADVRRGLRTESEFEDWMVANTDYARVS